jgi:hypothetical protein
VILTWSRRTLCIIAKVLRRRMRLSSNNDLIEILYTREEGMGLYPPDRTGKENLSVAAATLKPLARTN